MINFFQYWGKAHKDERFHLLALHCMDVASVAASWLEKSPVLRRALGATEDEMGWTLFFIALHDLGKFDVRFQLKAPEVAPRLHPLFCKENIVSQSQFYDHGQSGFSWFLSERTNFDLDNENAVLWMKAVAGHHGRVPNRERESLEGVANEKVVDLDRKTRRQWVGFLMDRFLTPGEIEKNLNPPSPSGLLAGFCCVCDWLGSNENYFPFVSTPPKSLDEYWEGCLDKATDALNKSGLLSNKVSQMGMDGLFPKYEPRGVQKSVSSWPLQPGLTLVEAPTGSGKTEAALAFVSCLLDKGLADSIIFALPTQATSNAMLSRLESVADTLWPGGSNMVLAHGKARWNPLFEELRKKGWSNANFQYEEAGVQCAQWLAKSRKRVFLGQIGVCTIDQILLSVLPVRHSFVRTFGVGRSVLVVDEVHAYDSYMNGLLDRVIEAQRNVGGSVLLLSATLPSRRRTELLKIYCPSHKETRFDGQSYPLVTQSFSEDVKCHFVEKPEERRVSARIHQTPDVLPDNALLEEIRTGSRQGQCVVIICNLVADAQGLARKLRKHLDCPVDLFHSRYRFCDRQKIEQDVLEHYGKDAPRKEGGRVLVATQVVEQSLDLDFDWMITQICPVDLLFQRMGRLHRHDRAGRPGGNAPEIVVLTPSDKEYGLHELIYGDPRLLWRTERLLDGVEHIDFPVAYREWIEKVYAEDAWDDEPEGIIDGHDKFVRKQNQKRIEADQLTRIDATPAKDNGNKVSILTRGSEMSLSVLPVECRGDARFCLGGEKSLNELAPWEQAEVKDLNGISVPRSWWRCFSEDTDHCLVLKMRPNAKGIWVAETDEYRIQYSLDFGLERTSI